MPLPNRLQRLVDLESEIAYRLPPPPGEVEFDDIPGTIPVLLSAPHGAAHTRNGRLKEEDEYTSGLAILLSELTGAHILFARRQSATDPNWYRDVPYKQRLAEIIASRQINFVIDLHGAHADRDFGLALGTMHGRSCSTFRPAILETLCQYGFSEEAAGLRRLDLDNQFTGGGGQLQETVTRFVWQELGVPAAQIEMNTHLRVVERLPNRSRPGNFRGEPSQIEHTIDTLLALIQTVTQ